MCQKVYVQHSPRSNFFQLPILERIMFPTLRALAHGPSRAASFFVPTVSLGTGATAYSGILRTFGLRSRSSSSTSLRVVLFSLVYLSHRSYTRTRRVSVPGNTARSSQSWTEPLSVVSSQPGQAFTYLLATVSDSMFRILFSASLSHSATSSSTHRRPLPSSILRLSFYRRLLWLAHSVGLISTHSASAAVGTVFSLPFASC